jgi:hypothetical protein
MDITPENTPNTHNSKKGFFNTKNILIICGVIVIVIATVIGFVGFQYYQQVQLSQSVADSVNQNNQGFSSIDKRLSSIADSLIAFEDTEPTDAQLDNIVAEIDLLEKETKEAIDTIQNGPVVETEELAVSLKDYLGEVSASSSDLKDLVNNTKCLLEYSKNITKFGNDTNLANDNIQLISKAYKESVAYIGSLGTCLENNKIPANDELTSKMNNLSNTTIGVYQNLDDLNVRSVTSDSFDDDIKKFEAASSELLDELGNQFEVRIKKVEDKTKELEEKADKIDAKVEEIRVKYDLVEE